jgi:actin-like ATPase involved in cell morphogenesis
MDPSGAERAQFNVINPQPVKKAMGGGLKDGGFVVPADVVSHLGNGSTDAGLAALQKRHGAQPIRGAGDGMSDSIKTTIDGKHPARIANGEAYISPEQVKRSGGAKKFYAMMDKVRKERTGTKKQGKQINPNKFMAA